MTTKDVLCAALVSCGGSQKELARRTDSNKNAVSRWFLGSASPSTRKLVRLARVAGLDPAEILRGTMGASENGA